MADSKVRAQRRERAALRRKEVDQQYVNQFAKRIRELFPNCPAKREKIIAEAEIIKNFIDLFFAAIIENQEIKKTPK